MNIAGDPTAATRTTSPTNSGACETAAISMRPKAYGGSADWEQVKHGPMQQSATRACGPEQSR